MSDKVIAWLRTVVPTLWGVAVAWLVTRVPPLSGLADSVNGVGVVVLVPVTVAAWKLALNTVEADMPPWLVAVLLGHPAAPTYVHTTPPATSMIAE